MTIATGVFKKLTAKLQPALGTIATTGAAQDFRRVTSTLNKKKAGYKSNEILPSLQRRDFRHGLVSVDGAINGELSPGTYQGFIGSALRSTWAVAAVSAAVATVTAAVTTGMSGTITRAAGSWITDGHRVGQVVRCTGWTTTGTANNAHNFLITALSALVMTVTTLDGVAVAAKASETSVTVTGAGKDASIPTSGHTRDYWTIEHWYSDIAQSERYQDCVIGGLNIKPPSSGIVPIDFPIMGLNMSTGTAQYFVTPTAVGAAGITASANGMILVNGVALGTVTSFDLSVKGNMKPVGGVVGSNVDPDIYPGAFDVDGTMNVLFDSATMRDYFLAETEVTISLVLTTSGAAAADFVAICLGRCKVNSADKNDGETGLMMTVPFVALENTVTTAGVETTSIMIQDSLAV